MRVLLAVGSPHLASILRSHIVLAEHEVIENDVHHINFIHEFIELENPSVIILHDHYLPSDKDTKETREEEMLRLVEYCRSAYEDSIRIIYVCERERRDPFLSQLVARNVLDIFNERQISVDKFISQLNTPPRFSNVERFGVGDIAREPEEEQDPVGEEPADDNEEADDELTKVTDEITLDLGDGSDSSSTITGLKDSVNNIGLKGLKGIKSLTERVNLNELKLPKKKIKPDKQPVDDITVSSDSDLDKERKTRTEIPKAESKRIPSIRINVQRATEIEKVKVSINRKIIAVISPFERSGTSFIAHQLAYQVAKQDIGVTYYENPLRRPYTYDRLGGHLTVPKYQSLYTDIDVKGLDEMDQGEQLNWKVDGVSIQALNPELERPLEEADLSVSRYLRMFLSAHETPYLVVDIGCDESRGIYDEIIEIASHIVVVVDGDISNLEWFEQYKIAPTFSWIHNALEDERTIVVANRFSEGMADVMPAEDFIPIPSFKDEWVFQAQLNGQLSFTKREALKEQDQSFRELVEHIVPKEELKRGGSVLRNLFPKVNIENTN